VYSVKAICPFQGRTNRIDALEAVILAGCIDYSRRAGMPIENAGTGSDASDDKNDADIDKHPASGVFSGRAH
jgi:hypothetical protein